LPHVPAGRDRRRVHRLRRRGQLPVRDYGERDHGLGPRRGREAEISARRLVSEDDSFLPRRRNAPGFARVDSSPPGGPQRRVLLLATVWLGSMGVPASAPDNSGAAALAKLASLAGEWEGPFEWTGARTGTGRMNVAYSVTGYGSAVVENLTVGGVPSMMSV